MLVINDEKRCIKSEFFFARDQEYGGWPKDVLYGCVTFLAPVCCNVSIFEAAKKRRRRLFPEKKNSVCVSLFLKVAWPFQG